MKNELKKYRLKKGWSQEELAEKSGVSRTTISGLENEDIAVTTTTTLQKLADTLGLKVSTLFFKD